LLKIGHETSKITCWLFPCKLCGDLLL